MTKVKYTLDKVENGEYVFLERENEENQLLIPAAEINVEIAEGSIVLISEVDSVYQFEVLREETAITLEEVNKLLEKLENKK